MSFKRSPPGCRRTLLLLALITACTLDPGRPTPQPSSQPPQTAAAEALPAAPTPTASPSALETPARTRYDLSAAFDDQTMHLDVTESVTYVNRSDVYMNELLFVVEPLRWEGAFQLKDIRWDDGVPVSSLGLERFWL